MHRISNILSLKLRKILKNDKNPKRSYKRHGVIICNDKKSRKNDEAIIKEFLKDFIPGDSEWIKSFRHDILKRWMKMYSISKSDLKELEKVHIILVCTYSIVLARNQRKEIEIFCANISFGLYLEYCF